jgi:hypothetical protein
MARTVRSFALLTMSWLLVLGTPREAIAQWNLARRTPGQTHVYLGGGVDHAAVGTLGAAHVTSLWQRALLLRLEGSVAAGGRDLADYGARAAAELSLLQRGALRMSLGLGAVNRGTNNTIFRANSFGTDIQSQVGVFGRHAFAAVELGLERSAVTHLAFTDRYRANYPAARDGWYATTATTARAGVALGLSVARSELMLRGGLVRAPRGEALIPPAYLSLGIGRRF